MTRLVVLALIESDDPRLDPQDGEPASNIALMEGALEALAGHVRHVVAVLPEQDASLMLYAHEMAIREQGATTAHIPSAALRARRH